MGDYNLSCKLDKLKTIGYSVVREYDFGVVLRNKDRSYIYDSVNDKIIEVYLNYIEDDLEYKVEGFDKGIIIRYEDSDLNVHNYTMNKYGVWAGLRLKDIHGHCLVFHDNGKNPKICINDEIYDCPYNIVEKHLGRTNRLVVRVIVHKLSKNDNNIKFVVYMTSLLEDYSLINSIILVSEDMVTSYDNEQYLFLFGAHNKNVEIAAIRGIDIIVYNNSIAVSKNGEYKYYKIGEGLKIEVVGSSTNLANKKIVTDEVVFDQWYEVKYLR